MPSGGQVLQISRVQQEDGGKYTCQAVNEAGEDHMHFELEILGKPACLAPLFKIYIIEYIDRIKDNLPFQFSPPQSPLLLWERQSLWRKWEQLSTALWFYTVM